MVEMVVVVVEMVAAVVVAVNCSSSRRNAHLYILILHVYFS